MRRHPALQDLSRDHHHVLLHARRLRGDDARVDAATARQRFLSYYDAILVHHLREEEEALRPHLTTNQADRLVSEHNQIRKLAADLATSSAGASELGELLRAHVRWEEDELFQDLQAKLQEAGWRTIQESLRTIRADEGRHDGEDCFL